MAGAWLAGAALLRATVAPAEVCPPLDEASARASITAAAAWMERNQLPDGRYLYEWHREDGDRGGYNNVRHAGVTMSLYQLAAAGEGRSLPVADRALEYMIANTMERDGWVAFTEGPGGPAKLGSNALMLAGLALRRQATGDGQHDELMRGLARFIVSLQREDGAFWERWLPETGAPAYGVTSKYATGEAFWALAMLHELFPTEGWDRPTWLVADYLALKRDAEEGFDFPPWADQWAAYGLGEMAEWGLAEHHIAYAESLAERFGFLVRADAQRRDGDFSRWLRGRHARAAGAGTWVEGLTSLWVLAGTDPRLAHLREDIGERAICAAGKLVARQVDAEEARGFRSPAIAEGAWFTDDVTRMDDQQHALSGILRTLPILEERDRE